MKVLAIGGSNSTTSINRQLANYVASLISEDVTVCDLSQSDLPLYSVQREEKEGICRAATTFAQQIDQADFLVVSLAEHNGSYCAAFKNLVDWTSRIKDRKVWADKPMLLMATSPGGRGGATVLGAAATSFPHLGADVKATFSLPSFYQNFDKETGITNEELKQELLKIVGEVGA